MLHLNRIPQLEASKAGAVENVAKGEIMHGPAFLFQHLLVAFADTAFLASASAFWSAGLSRPSIASVRYCCSCYWNVFVGGCHRTVPCDRSRRNSLWGHHWLANVARPPCRRPPLHRKEGTGYRNFATLPERGACNSSLVCAVRIQITPAQCSVRDLIITCICSYLMGNRR